MQYYKDTTPELKPNGTPKLFKRLRASSPEVEKNLICGTVLLIEPSKEKRKRIKKSIEKNCALIEASSIESGIAKCINHRPKVIFLNIDFPQDQGQKTLKWILRNYPNTHVVALTNNEDNHHIAQAHENGAKGFIIKYFNTHELKYHLINSNTP